MTLRALSILALFALLALAQDELVYTPPPEQLPMAVPPQPAPFNHKAHAEQGLECLDCHPGAEKKRAAGLPKLKDCLLCHQTIATDSPDVQKMLMLANQKIKLEWVRVYRVPDFVFFNHKRHVQAGETCETCHGPVATREVLAKEVSTNMTACMNCHAEKGATTECFFCHELGQ